MLLSDRSSVSRFRGYGYGPLAHCLAELASSIERRPEIQVHLREKTSYVTFISPHKNNLPRRVVINKNLLRENSHCNVFYRYFFFVYSIII